MASSKKTISGSFKKALAIPILCLSPPESFIPLLPIIVSRPSSLFSKKCERFNLSKILII